MRCLIAQACKKLSEEYYKQSINDLLNQCGGICRDKTIDSAGNTRVCRSQSTMMRDFFFDFMIEHIKMSKRDQEESARIIISRGLGCKAGIPLVQVMSTLTLTNETQEKIFNSTRVQL